MNTTLTVAVLTAVAIAELAVTARRIHADKATAVASRPIVRHRRPSLWHRHPAPWPTARGAIDDVMPALAGPAVPYELKPAEAMGRLDPAQPDRQMGSLSQRRLDDTMRIPPYVAEVA
jgi:hypothetical protein